VIIDWVAVQAVATVTLVATSLGAIGYAGLQLKHEREYRSVANLEKQLAYFLGDTFAAARQRLAASRLLKVEPVADEPETLTLAPWSSDDPPISSFEVLDFYEHLALLVKKGHLDLYDVWHTFYEWAQPVYIDLQAMIENPDSPYRDHYLDLQRMMRQMDDVQLRRMHAQQSNHWALWTNERILEHYRYELEIGSGSRPRHTRRQRPQPVKQSAA
jgi:hypothetical protein